MTQSDPNQILQLRAQALARPITPPAPTTSDEVVLFRLGTELFAIDASRVAAAVVANEIVPVPGAEPPIAGLMVWRGRILTVLDPRAILGVGIDPADDPRTVIILDDEEHPVGILIHRVEGLCRRPAHVPPDAPGDDARGAGLELGMSGDAMVVLSARALARLHR